MNESHFKFFLLYLIDLHNLHIEGRVSTLANPLNENRDIHLIANNIGKINLVERHNPILEYLCRHLHKSGLLI